MPYYFGSDYYNMIITHRQILLNKAIMTVPHLLPKHENRLSVHIVNDIWSALVCQMERFTDVYEVTPDKNFIGVLHGHEGLRDGVVESYQSNAIITCIGGELMEAIPSSNPESECIPELDVSREQGMLCTRNQIISLETFAAQQIHTERFEPLEVPQNINELKLAIRKLPTVSVLLSRQQEVDLDDPLLKSDGTKWKEADFFNFICTDAYPLQNEHIVKMEQFQILSIDKEKEQLMEPLVSPSIPTKAIESYLEERHNLELLKELLSSCHSFKLDFLSDDQDFHVKILSFGLNTSNEELTFEDNSLSGQTNKPSFLRLSNIGSTSLSPVQSYKEVKRCTSPLLGFSLKKLEKNFYEEKENIVQLTLQTLCCQKEEGLLLKCSLIQEKKRTLLQSDIWEREKHFDEVRIPEPSFTQDSLPDPVSESLAVLKLQPEEMASTQFNLRWSLEPLRFQNLLSDSMLLANDVKIHQPNQLECFQKHYFSKLGHSLMPHGQDSFDWDIKQEIIPGHQNIYQPKVVDQIQDEENPLDLFMNVRANRNPLNTSAFCNRNNGQLNTEMKLEQCKGTSVTTLSQGVCELTANSKTIQVPFCGPFEAILQILLDAAASHINQLRQEGMIEHLSFFSIPFDKLMFLLKEEQKKAADQGLSEKGSRLKSTTLLNIFKKATDLLLNACLESCIAYLAAQTSNENAWLTDSIEDIHSQLIQSQCRFLQEKITHPKLTLLASEIGIFSAQHPGNKILVLVQRGLHSLVFAIQQVLSTVPHVTVTVIKDIKSASLESNLDFTLFITHIAELSQLEMLSRFHLVVLYDSKGNNTIHDTCRGCKISYIGLISELQCEVKKTDTFIPQDKTDPITIICSSDVTQYRQLLYILESRFNILIFERDYTILRKNETKVYYADLIISVTHCITLLPIHEMRQGWNLKEVMKRFVALGLQFTHCYIVLHGIGTVSRYLMDKETSRNLYRLLAALCNLREASDKFNVLYKVLMCINEEEVSCTIKNIVDTYMASQAQSDFLRPWLSADLSQNEEFLLQFPCLHSLSAQLLLRHLTVKEIIDKSDEEIKSLIPDIPMQVCKYLQHMTCDWKSQHITSCSSQSSATLIDINDKSTGSVSHHNVTSPNLTVTESDAVSPDNDPQNNYFNISGSGGNHDTFESHKSNGDRSLHGESQMLFQAVKSSNEVKTETRSYNTELSGPFHYKQPIHYESPVCNASKEKQNCNCHNYNICIEKEAGLFNPYCVDFSNCVNQFDQSPFEVCVKKEFSNETYDDQLYCFSSTSQKTKNTDHFSTPEDEDIIFSYREDDFLSFKKEGCSYMALNQAENSMEDLSSFSRNHKSESQKCGSYLLSEYKDLEPHDICSYEANFCQEHQNNNSKSPILDMKPYCNTSDGNLQKVCKTPPFSFQPIHPNYSINNSPEVNISDNITVLGKKKSINGYGIFSSKASRICPHSIYRNAPQTDDTMLERRIVNKQFGNTSSNAVCELPQISYKSFSTDNLPIYNSRLDVGSLPFSVSRNLQKHIRKLEHASKSKLSFIGSLDSVRVSRPTKFSSDYVCTSESHLNCTQSKYPAACNKLNIQNFDMDNNEPFPREDEVPTTLCMLDANLVQPLVRSDEASHIYGRNDHNLPAGQSRQLPSDYSQNLSTLSSSGMHQNNYSQNLQSDSVKNIRISSHLQGNNSSRYVPYTCDSKRPLFHSEYPRGHDINVTPSYRSHKNWFLQSSKPCSVLYTPRQGVTIGLAQPLRRQDSSTDKPASPPMDLLSDDDHNLATINRPVVAQTKLKKWSSYLLHQTIHAKDQPDVSEQHNQCNFDNRNELHRSKQLRWEKQAGNNGQTVLVFK